MKNLNTVHCQRRKQNKTQIGFTPVDSLNTSTIYRRSIDKKIVKTHAKYGSDVRVSPAGEKYCRGGFESGGFTTIEWRKMAVTHMDKQYKMQRTPLLQILQPQNVDQSLKLRIKEVRQ